MKIKDKFPNEDSLKEYILSRLAEFTVHVRGEIGHLEEEFIYNKRRFAAGMIMIVGGFLSISFSAEIQAIQTKYAVILWIILLVIMYLGWKKISGTMAVIKAFNESADKVFFPMVFDMFDIDAETVSYSTSQEVNSLLVHSELITENRNRFKVDDMFSITTSGRTLFVSELDVKNVTGSGKNRHVKNIFKGYFVTFDLKKHLLGKTFVSTEGDKSGFGHMNFFRSALGKGAQETVLEWNDFEKLLHVASTDPVEARYILSPDFMLDLHEWWKEKKSNVRLSFIGGRMYMLFPNQKIRFDSTIYRINEKEVQEYLESITIPLLHVLHLVEDVEDQFRH